MNHQFEGTYYKHQNKETTLCLIVGRFGQEKFIQVITNQTSYRLPDPGGNLFSPHGIKLDIHTKDLTLTGELAYHNLSPISYDIMGPFRYSPMECRHGIISMSHSLTGAVELNGTIIDFTGGAGYMETDSGTSFPNSYVWVHANDFREPCSIMASVASIPFMGFRFQGCICVIHYQGKEFRMATYLGGKVVKCTPSRLILQQRNDRLEITLSSPSGHPLQAPVTDGMNRTILESAATPAQFRFFHKKKELFSLSSEQTSYEYEM